ncbi:FxSxx-COOH system tetratricopeptide repeat protein [Actinosynnema pretiosum]|uniref:ATP/GTP-binding protein n=1 Tax=Actinosynnema pretiosum TaxID=42197 RepID=A0A290Z8Y3_9PSEU|nr:FxSxx-COOH system tetratricopeptide repeat protein [Actinosynnema pretiosum]ATE55490.1 ATP/GTP-binding protein [Actinosynnema pretiosum]
MSGLDEDDPRGVAFVQHLDPLDEGGPVFDAAALTAVEVRDVLWLAAVVAGPDHEPTSPGDPGPAQDEDPVGDPPVRHDREEDPGGDGGSSRAEEQAPSGGPPPGSGSGPSPPGGRTGRRWGVGGPETALLLDAAAPSPDAPLSAGGWPTVQGLPDRRRISRVLRRLDRDARSADHDVLDEEATAVRAAEAGLWAPRWLSEPRRHFEVLLVVDTSLATGLWTELVREFRALLERQGAFRDVRVYWFDSEDTDHRSRSLRSEGGAPHGWWHLVGGATPRIVLVLTEATGKAWRTGAAAHLLNRWGGRLPVAVVNVLPQRMWPWGGLAARRMRLSAPHAGAANRWLRDAGEQPSGDGVLVPVLGLAAPWFSGWARLLTARGHQEPVETTAVLVHPQTDEQPCARDGRQDVERDEPTPAQRVRRFRTYASADGFQLAGLLAATPLSPALMKLVQRVMLPGSDMSAMAEVALGGLLTRRARADQGRDTIAYDFAEGVRPELLATCRRSDTARVARVLAERAGGRFPALLTLGRAIDAPDTAELPPVTEETLPYVRVQAAVLTALSGRYAKHATRLTRSLVEQGFHTAEAIPPPHPAEDAPPPLEPTVSTAHHPQERGAGVATASPDHVRADDARTGWEPGAPSTRDSGQPQVWGQVPLAPPNFVGRAYLLEKLRARLTESGPTAVLPEALHGMGGVGKSYTVIEYIHRHAGEYDLVWWISAEHVAQINSAFVELAKRLGVPRAETADAAVPAVREALRRGEPFKRWMLVFDNADRPQDVKPFFPSSGGHIIITSRNSEWAMAARAVEVDLFTRAESVELLKRRGGALADDEADALAEALGDLPLAVDQAAAWRAQTGMQVSEYLELLRQNRTELLEAGTSSEDQLPVAAAWNVPLKRLSESHPAALQLLQLCAFFGPEPISQRLFRGVHEIPVPPALSEALRDSIKFSRAVREISRYSLAKLDHRNNTLQLHRLVQTVLKDRLDEADREQFRQAVHELLAKGDPIDPDIVENWPRYAELLPHALMSQAVGSRSRLVRVFVLNLVQYLINSGDWTGARDLASRAVAVWDADLGPSDDEQGLHALEMSRRLAVAIRRLGAADEAVELNKQTLERFRATIGEDHELFLRMLDTVAADRRSQGRYTEERELQQQVCDRAVALLGEDDPETLVYVHNLASCHRLMGDYGRARALDEDNLRRRITTLGPKHILTFGSRNAVSMDLRECGYFVQAAEIQQKTLGYMNELFGPDHPATIGANRNLSVALRKAGRHARAKELAEECLERYRRKLGDDHLDTMTALMNTSTDLRHLGELEASEEAALRSYRVFRDLVSGPEHPYTLIAALNLGVTYRLLGKLDEALETNRGTRDALLRVFGADHPTTLVAVTNLASDLAESGEVELAREHDTDTLARSTRVLGPEHPSTLAVALNLAIDLAALGEESQAAVLHGKTVASFRRVLGDDHPATSSAAQYVRANCDTDTMQF